MQNPLWSTGVTVFSACRGTFSTGSDDVKCSCQT